MRCDATRRRAQARADRRELETGGGRARSWSRGRGRHRRRPARPDAHRLPPRASTDARVALTLRLVGGLTTPIARAFLVPEATVAQRIVRAKRTLAEAGVPFEIPRGASSRRGCRRCSRWSTSSSTRATRRRPATTGCGRRCARTRCASAASSPAWCPRARGARAGGADGAAGVLILVQLEAPAKLSSIVEPIGEMATAITPEANSR